MDIPEVADAKPAKRRNFAVTDPDRAKLAIDGGTVKISGADISGPAYRFNGEFFGIPVSLGELRSDEAGRLIILGGQGVSGSYAHQPLQGFSNNDGWHDDSSDGPVTAVVTIDGQAVPVDPAWVVIAPPNYAPNVKTLLEQRPGVADDPNLPPTMQVSTFPLLLMLPLEPGPIINQPLAAVAEAHAMAMAARRAELRDPWAGRFAWRRSDNGS